MTSAADLSHAVLIRVADFLRTLPPDQLAALADGTAQLSVSGGPSAAAAIGPAESTTTGQPPAAGRGSGARKTPTRAAKPAPVVDTERIRTDLATIDDRVAAGRYLDDLGLRVTDLKALAAELGVALPSRATKAVMQKSIVQAMVGRRLTSAVLSRPADHA
ncbi:hypothetical protein [Micromonospora sp. LOL_023]|uniref:hypothetical protein n=1 Tax=Micromonospora sp. LOL_023 TaxID=3345418 RepID=UPI003A850F5C